MTNYYLLILGYLLISASILFFVYRFKKTSLSKKDYELWLKTEEKLKLIQVKIFKIFQISQKEIIYLLRSLKEKILRRIKIEALKIESWANKKIEKMKEEQNSENIL